MTEGRIPQERLGRELAQFSLEDKINSAMRMEDRRSGREAMAAAQGATREAESKRDTTAAKCESMRVQLETEGGSHGDASLRAELDNALDEVARLHPPRLQVS